MLIFIDESGIHKKVDHSSFVLVYVSIEDENFINARIEQIEKRLKIRFFHWADFGSKAGWLVRKEFIRLASDLPFVFKYLIMENPLKPQKILFYCLNHLLTEKDIKNVIIDGKQPKWYEKQMKHLLRSKGISVKKLKTANDKSMPALRLADALAGLIRSYYDGSKTSQELYQLMKIKNKITVQLKMDGQVSC